MIERTLVTGFGPFLDVKDNPSAQLAEGSARPFHVLDVSYDCVEDFIFHLDPATFDRLLMIGVSQKRTQISPELFARNVYGKQKDNGGTVREGSISLASPLLIESSLWNDEVIADLAATHLSSLRISMDAGSYLCNFTYFKALQAFPSKRVGFLHVPSTESMPLEKQAIILQDILLKIED